MSEALSEIDTSCDRLTLRFAPPLTSDSAKAKPNGKGKGRVDITELDEEEEETDEDDENSVAQNGRQDKAAFALEGNSNTGSFRVSLSLCSLKELGLM